MIDYTAKDIGMIGNFRFWCQKILPAVYDDSLSYYEVICKLIDKVNEIINKYDDYDELFAETIELLKEFEKELEDFKEHGFDEYYARQVYEWISANLEYIYDKTIAMVFFGLTLDGHFVAYVPDSWKEIVFDTGMVYGSPNYGRLILKYDVDSPYSVEQPSDPDADDISTIMESIYNLNLNVNRLNRTNYTPLEGGE